MNKRLSRHWRQRFRLINLLLMATVFVVVSLAAYFLLGYAKDLLKVRDIQIYGAQRIRIEEIKGLTKIKRGDRLFEQSNSEVHKRLMAFPWIKEAVVRKDLSGNVYIRVMEAVPAALLSYRGRTYLIDLEGVLLEDIGDTKTFFLPLIRDIDPYKNKPAYKEALSFLNFIGEKRIFSNIAGLEITAQRPEDLSLRIENLIIKIGAGDYEKKMSRLEFVRKEIASRNIPVETIDLRFNDKVVVRPTEKAEGKRGVEQNTRR